MAPHPEHRRPPSASSVEVTTTDIADVDPEWFSSAELAAARASEAPAAHLLRRAAAKRAVLLALGLPAEPPFGALVEIHSQASGRPRVSLHRQAADHAAERRVRLVDLSLSSDAAVAAALAVVVTDSSNVQHLCLISRGDQPAR